MISITIEVCLTRPQKDCDAVVGNNMHLPHDNYRSDYRIFFVYFYGSNTFKCVFAVSYFLIDLNCKQNAL